MRPFGPVVAGVLFIVSQFLFPSSMAWATLGEVDTSIEQDSLALTATFGVVRVEASYMTRDIVSDSIAVREYVGRDGVVFGLSWSGRNHPDFSALLGSYYGEYLDINPNGEGPRMRGSRRLMKGSRLVVEKYGHMGKLRGRAFLPSKVPPEMDPNEIK